MSILKTILERRTIHEYTSKPIDFEVIKQSLEAALHAPNHRHTHPWLFVHVGPKARGQLADLAVEIKSSPGSPLNDVMIQAIRKKVLEPNHLIVFCRKHCPDAHQAREDYASIACAVQNFSLCLWEKGVGTKWSTGAIIRHPSAYEILTLDSQSFHIEGFLWAGVPQKIPEKPKRPQLEDIVIHLH